MELYEDFDFISDDGNDVVYGDFLLKRTAIHCVLQSIQDGIEYIQSSPYSCCFDQVDILLTDFPGELTEFVDVNTETNRLYIHISVAGAILYYEHEPFFRQLIFQDEWKQIDLYTYTQFFFFHECGHIVHAHLENPQATNSVAAFIAFGNRYAPYLAGLEQRHDRLFETDDPFLISKPIQRAYRKLPQEKNADRFAFTALHTMQQKNQHFGQ